MSGRTCHVVTDKDVAEMIHDDIWDNMNVARAPGRLLVLDVTNSAELVDRVADLFRDEKYGGGKVDVTVEHTDERSRLWINERQ